jgi:hypothetical protein
LVRKTRPAILVLTVEARKKAESPEFGGNSGLGSIGAGCVTITSAHVTKNENKLLQTVGCLILANTLGPVLRVFAGRPTCC